MIAPRSTGRLALLMLLAGCAGSAPPTPSSMQTSALAVHIRPDAGLRQLEARVCGDPLASRLIPGVPWAAHHARDFRTDRGVALTLRDGGVDVPAGTRCVRYVVDLRAAATGETRTALRTTPGHLIWRPQRLPAPAGLRAILTADLGPHDLSLPWPRLPDRGGHRAWSIPWNGFRYSSHAVLGRYPSSALPVPGGVLNVAWFGDPIGDRARFERWLTAAGEDVATVFGGLPVPAAQVVVVFGYRSRSVGFAATARGGGPGVILHVGDRTPPEALAEDWTATHELFHLGLPLTTRRDAWFSEGVTTVYTYLAMGRSGRLSPAEVREELAAGFARGAWRTGRSLRADSATMGETGSWWRVYWGGGAWALERAVAMARAGHDFDDVLELWSTAARDPGPATRAMKILRWADDRVPGHDLAATARRALEDVDFPETEALIEALADDDIGPRLWGPRPVSPPAR